MKSIKLLISTLIISAFLMACSPSTEELTEQVKQSMTEKFQPEGISITNLILTKKSDYEYSGILETKEPNGSFTYSVDVTSDGDSFNWKIVQ